jgi:hypothetical protein
MTDKVQKIRAEIERRYNEYMAKDSELAAIRADECLDILSYIDSMQEEPTTSVWHDASETPVASKTKIVLYTNGKWDMFKAYEAKDNYDNYWAGVNQALEEKGVLVKKWAYVDELLNF